MKLNRVLTINQIPRVLIDERIVLDLYGPGRAQFTLLAGSDPVLVGQLVVYEFGYASQDKVQRWFIGSVDKVVPVNEDLRRVFCRDLSAVLAHPLPLDLRHVSLRDVVAEINRITGLNFSVPDRAYADTRVANFYNMGSGYLAMAALGSVFNIPDFIWQQQGGGVIYVGSWTDSRWAGIKNLLLPNKFFDSHSANESARIAAMPQLRPGMRLNHHRLIKIEFQASHMTLSWGKR